MNNPTLPPYIQTQDRVLLFDGVCKLCHVWSRFILRFDRAQNIKLCSVQSPEGQAILAHFSLPLDQFDSLVYVEGANHYLRSNAVLNVLRQLPWPWPAFYIFKLIPRPLRDWGYNRIAQNRYRLFGRYAQCQLPSTELRQRFLDGQCIKPSEHH
ncbi:thiol-disulfide oxidoreductase DCC family protein [Spongiibacter sp. IMCC21906]|uniref:thiol-disulfide oxidoreductase DCC family protein n=1 Tax=Spongiibacter sp. IMCC21906 TaxID=1620392 RepID=UPI00062E8331|nr:thiol-disulfide oxidoreductase DCC family protein [Spongiibacter sp. IMCC21906]